MSRARQLVRFVLVLPAVAVIFAKIVMHTLVCENCRFIFLCNIMYCLCCVLQEEKVPYAFYVNDQELVGQLGTYLLENKGME